MSEPLICIDIQECFVLRERHYYQQMIDHAMKQCSLAMKRRDNIIFVEFDMDGYYDDIYSSTPIDLDPTLHELVKLTDGYSKRFFVRKHDQDGGKEVFALLKAKRIAASNIRVCGVYTDQCVHSTVQSLTKMLPKSTIKIVRGATSSGSHAKENEIKAFEKLSSLSRQVKMIGPYLWT